MKKYLFSLLLFCSLAATAAQYYVAGDGRNGNPWCDAKSWQVTGSPMTMDAAGTNGSITFVGVPAGAYQFKVTNGSSWYGVSKFDASASNLYANGSDNICFSLQAAQDVTITYNGSKITLNGTIGNEHPDPSQYGLYGVPSEYEGVMLQAFYWNGHAAMRYGETRWKSFLDNYAVEVGDNFDLVWFPPSGGGKGGGVGYYCKQYSNQTSDWGTGTRLTEVIDTLHAHGCKALADVVVNHRASSAGWAQSFSVEDFGNYGTFQITSEHICAGDEAFTSSSSDSKSLPHGASDTGDNDGGCRDLDHTSTYVQDYIKAYVQWLMDSIHYDGFRYDMVKGYAGQYVSLYNKTAEPYFSVAEYWDGASAIKSYLETASYNTTCFDFALKYKFNDWRGGASYTNLKNQGLRALGLSKYAVTFIDNHDTFEREDNQSGEFIGYKVKLTDKKDAIIQANAYLLSMPGTPCVFWPHWYTFRPELKLLIALRHAAGVHSESVVSGETAASGKYEATITGHRGNLILRMGAQRDLAVPAGYFRAISSEHFDIYASDGVAFQPATISTSTALEDIDLTPSPRAVKRLENNHIVIDCEGRTFDVLGNQL